MKKESSRARATLMKSKSCTDGARAMFMTKTSRTRAVSFLWRLHSPGDNTSNYRFALVAIQHNLCNI